MSDLSPVLLTLENSNFLFIGHCWSLVVLVVVVVYLCVYTCILLNLYILFIIFVDCKVFFFVRGCVQTTELSLFLYPHLVLYCLVCNKEFPCPPTERGREGGREGVVDSLTRPQVTITVIFADVWQ